MIDTNILNFIPDIAWLASGDDGKMIFVNNEFKKYTGAEEDQLLGDNWANFIHPDDIERVIKVITKAFKGDGRYVTELRWKRADGTYEWYLENAMRTTEGFWSGVCTYIQDRKDLEEEARRMALEKEKREVEQKLLQETIKIRMEFFAKMSHEIRTPLHGILGANDILKGTSLTSEQRQWLSVVEMSGESLVTIINDILDFTKMETGKLELNLTHIRPIDIIESVKGVVMSICQRKNIQLNVEYDETLPEWCKGDGNRIRQVLLNLVSNAVKFTPEDKGLITISLHKTSKLGKFVGYTFKVADNGIGMSETTVKKLFNPYVQADETIASKFGGTGLGLAICKNIIDLMDGQIKVKSTEGAGSIFEFSIYMEESDKQQIEKTVIDLDALKKQMLLLRIVIMMCEDNPLNQMIAEKSLSNFGIIVLTVNNGLRAVERYKDLAFDCILMDCHMPVMDGYEATTKIRELELAENKKRIPIIALTASVMDTEVQRCLQVGMDSVCYKPFNTQTLVLMIRDSVLKYREEV